jgi:glutathione S-transferase
LRNQSLTDADRQQRRAVFEQRLDHLESCVGERGGPFLFGTQLGLVDAMYAPFLERWAVQLPLTSEFNLRPVRGSSEPARWPKIEAWFVAMASVPAYASRVSGDAYSWSAAVATFQRMFSANGTLTDAQHLVAKRADSAALLELKHARQEGIANGVSSSAALAAAKVRLSRCPCSHAHRMPWPKP